MMKIEALFNCITNYGNIRIVLNSLFIVHLTVLIFTEIWRTIYSCLYLVFRFVFLYYCAVYNLIHLLSADMSN